MSNPAAPVGKDSALYFWRAALLLALAILPYAVATAGAVGLVPESPVTRWMESGITVLGVAVTLGLAIAAWRASLAAMKARAVGTVASPASSVAFLLSVLTTIATGLLAVALLLLGN